MIKEIAKRIGRPGVEIVDINFSGLFAALFSKRIEFTVNPLNITAERAERMLYTEPFFATGNGFMVRAADSMKGFEDLKGKQLAVNRGTISDTWATQNAEKYGFEVQRYDTFPDSVQAVITRRAFTALNEIPTAVYAASQNKAIKVGFKDFNGRNFGYAFRLESTRLPQHGRGGDRMHEEGRHAREDVREMVRLEARCRLVDQHGLPGLRPAGLQGLRRDAARAELQVGLSSPSAGRMATSA